MAEISLYHEELGPRYKEIISNKLIKLGVSNNLWYFSTTHGSIYLKVDNPNFLKVIEHLKELGFKKDINYTIIFGLKESYSG